MPPSQLKKLKASLREQGIVGPQKSKKQKKQNAQNGASVEKRIQRNVALNSIREIFNPFEFKLSARGPKFDITSNKGLSGGVSKSTKARPGVTKGLGEETRRKTLLVELQRRNKVGGIMDRRFGENDPTIAPEEKMLERYTQEKQRRHKNNSVFDLEDEEGSGELTHMGQSLALGGPTLADDFDGEGLGLSDADDYLTENRSTSQKRRRASQLEGLDDNDAHVEGQPERKKTKQEVMKEVIAKSKLYKYERQVAKDEDEDLREELDKEIGEIHALLRGTRPPPAATYPSEFSGMNAERAARLNSTDKERLEKEYDIRLRQLAQDKKSKPTERTKTEEERLAEESSRLKELEERRLRRMRGQPEDEEEEKGANQDHDSDAQSEASGDFGLGTGIGIHESHAELGVEDEDDFVIDEDLVASGSDIENSQENESSPEADDRAAPEDEDYLDGLLTEEESKRPEFLTGSNRPLEEMEGSTDNGTDGNLPYTFSCPETHEELLAITKNVADQDLPEVVRRIRALYHPKLKGENKVKLANFTTALVDHVSFLANRKPSPHFGVLESLIRHIHSLAKMFPVEAGNVFRKHLGDLSKFRALAPTSGDLILAAAISTIFPTSDHFHQVVTPAMLNVARYIGQKIPHKLCEYSTGVYLTTLALRYQKVSKRYVPEVIGFLINTLCAFIPTKPQNITGNFAYHESKLNRLEDAHAARSRKLNFRDTSDQKLNTQEEIALKVALIETSIKLLESAADIWTGKSACEEIFEPALALLKHIGSSWCSSKLPDSTQTAVSKTSQKLQRLLTHARLVRRPLELHHHRPLAIKTSIPKFEESFNPDKHYDPDRERADASKLRAEYKRERKGAMRELRKDANFIARESLREKKERDAAYEKKYKRLVAEIQGEEGREAKAYEREKEWRKKGKK